MLRSIFTTIFAVTVLLVSAQVAVPKNSIKIGTLNPLNAELPFFMEHHFSPKWSAELGLGATLWTPALMSAMNCSPTFQGLPIERAKLGLYVAPSVRYYPMGQERGLYLATGATVKQFNYKIVNIDGDIQKAYRRDVEYARVSLGYVQTWGRILGEFQIGAAARYVTKTTGIENDYAYYSSKQPKTWTPQVAYRIGWSF